MRVGFTIEDEAVTPVDDERLVALLREVYVGGGFTNPDLASSAFTPAAVRARGCLLCAWDDSGALAGMVIVVPPDSPARRLAGPDEAEPHLMAVAQNRRRAGIGDALLRAALARARSAGYRACVLWTQPTMLAAHRLYERAGFSRSPSEDFERAGRAFQVYRTPL